MSGQNVTGVSSNIQANLDALRPTAAPPTSRESDSSAQQVQDVQTSSQTVATPTNAPTVSDRGVQARQVETQTTTRAAPENLSLNNQSNIQGEQQSNVQSTLLTAEEVLGNIVDVDA